MPYVLRAGARTHYTVQGAGPLVVLLHGLLMADAWEAGGIAHRLADHFTVVCVDSLGDGRSDRPSEPMRYSQSERAADVIAVLDEIACARAHVVGYSMGGWLAVGVAKHHAARLRSLTIGGWNIEDGMPHGPAGRLSFDQFMAYARRAAPALTSAVNQEAELGLRHCFDTMTDLDGAAEALLRFPRPVLLWSGNEDPYHRAMASFASVHGLPFLATKGDHLSAVYDPDADGLNALRRFLMSADGTL